MKVLPFKISKPEHAAIVYQEYYEDNFYRRLHQHEEIQLSLILNGIGTLVIGDSVNDFKTYDVLIIGRNLPHVFNSDGSEQEKSHMLSIFFNKDSFGKGFFELNEFASLNTFFKQSAYGIRIISNNTALKKLFLKFNNASKLNRFIILFEILQLISKSKTKLLSSFVYKKSYSNDQGKRMSDVFEHTMNNFQHNISLNEIANVANMTPQSFCKYFKQRTNKTYFSFLIELRIEHSCKLILANNDFSISEISIKSGFINISNFNRKFKLQKKTTPLRFRKFHLSG
ncbi:AraC family transcriptional regulator [Maribacter antarcticus]|uniref:AraC family transcriptional regulator n=1 Tax=Maribacter antarcticus TaxID=505250 RepID=UPI00047C99A0|nr:AraC family transcriptional regulator [Maribacter antarcticus]